MASLNNEVVVHGGRPDVIDLCDETDERKPPPKKKRKLPPPPQSIDAIVVDNCPTSSLSKDDEYKQALGPVRMEFVESWKNPHFFANQPQPRPNSLRNLYQELLEYQLNLPISVHSSIFVRAQESRLDLLRVLITGPAETPYSNGCFLFDVYLNDYPDSPPKVQFLTTNSGRVRFNPNLYACGKVCLSLLGTWSGPSWIRGQSTFLQVLVSIQALILVAEPYFNEPGFEGTRGKPIGQRESQKYNATIQPFTLQHAIAEPLSQVVEQNKLLYPEFQNVMTRHFLQQQEAIREQVRSWSSGIALQKTSGQICDDLDRLEAAAEKESKQPAVVSPPETIVLE